VHAIDAASGELKAGAQVTMGTQPNWVEIIDLKGWSTWAVRRSAAGARRHQTCGAMTRRAWSTS